MNKQQLELARRAVACDHWRWMEGIKVIVKFSADHEEFRLVRVKGKHSVLAVPLRLEQFNIDTLTEVGALPDLTDPATLGCLLHLVREAWGDPLARVERTNRFYTYDDRGTGCSARAWAVHIKTPPHLTRIPADTEIEALINALEAAND